MVANIEAYDNPQQAALIGWMAGFFDAEGTFTINRKPSTKLDKFYYRPRVCMGSVDRQALEVYVDYFGGKIYTERVPEGRKQMYRWVVGDKTTSGRIALTLLPLLIEKKQRAELMARYTSLQPDELHQVEELYQEMGKLNRSGAAATTE